MVVSANFTKVFEQWMTLQSCESWAEHTVADVQSLILITWGLPVRKSLIQEHIEVDNTMLWSFSGSLSRITVLKAAEVNDAIRWLQLQVTPGCVLLRLYPLCIGSLYRWTDGSQYQQGWCPWSAAYTEVSATVQ